MQSAGSVVARRAATTFPCTLLKDGAVVWMGLLAAAAAVAGVQLQELCGAFTIMQQACATGSLSWG